MRVVSGPMGNENVHFEAPEAEMLEKLVIINGAHPFVSERELRENPAQRYASNYFCVFNGYLAPGEQPVPLDSAMLSEVRSRIRKAGSAVGLPESVTGDLVIAGSEASLNAVVHATGGIAEIRGDVGGSLQIWVRDCGAGIDDAFLHRAILEAGFSSKGTLGQGFSLIVSTCHRVYLLTGSTGTTIVLATEVSQRFAPPA